MTGLKIKICFWYLNESIVKDVLQILKDGEIVATYHTSNDRSVLSARLAEDQPDLIISDFDLPQKTRRL